MPANSRTSHLDDNERKKEDKKGRFLFLNLTNLSWITKSFHWFVAIDGIWFTLFKNNLVFTGKNAMHNH